MKAFALILLSAQVCFLVGCSGSNTLSITLSSPTGQSLNAGQSLTITATVANDKNGAGVTWALSGTGALSQNTPTSVIYTAPSNVEAATTVTITATSVANSTIVATETITINAVLGIITTSLPAATQGVPYDTFITAGGASTPFTWSVISGKLPPGLTFLTSSTSNSAEITGTPTILGASTFTVQVTDSSNASVSQSLTITVYPPPPLSVSTPYLPAGMVGVNYSQTLLASSGVQPYTWSIAAGNLPVNVSLAANGVISGTPAATGTYDFTVKVTDSTKPTAQIATANLSIAIAPGSTNNGRLSGPYAFSVSGWDSSGFFAAAGQILTDGSGNVTSGTIDTNDIGSGPLSQTVSGTYSIGQDGLGTMTLNAASGSRTFALSMMANSNANIIEFDDFNGAGTRNSGVLLKQTPGTIGAGSYAFGFLGIDSNKSRFGVAGEFQADGSGNITGGLLDVDDSGTLSSSVTITSGAYAIDSNGRGTASITSSLGTYSYSFYVVGVAAASPVQLLVVSSDPFVPGGVPLVGGSILQQSGGFTAASLGAPGVFQVTALSGATVEDQVGVFSPNGAGGFSLASDQNSGGILSSPSSSTGTYTVDPSTGRTTLATSGFQNSDPVMYLVGTNQAFIIGTDAAVSFGVLTPQSGQPFSSTALSGTYAGGSTAPPSPDVSNAASIALAGGSNFTTTADISDATGLSQVQSAEVISSVDPSGRVQITLRRKPDQNSVHGFSVTVLWPDHSSEY